MWLYYMNCKKTTINLIWDIYLYDMLLWLSNYSNFMKISVLCVLILWMVQLLVKHIIEY